MNYVCIFLHFLTTYVPSLHFLCSKLLVFLNTYPLETVQDFLIKLDIKPLMHLLEISIYSLNNDLVRLNKIMNNLVKDLKILSFKVIFQCLKLAESFQKKKKSVKNIWFGEQLILMKFFENFDFWITLFTKNVPNFCQLCS